MKRDHGQNTIHGEKKHLLCQEFIGKLKTGFEINVIIVSFDLGYIVRIIFSNGNDSFSAVLERTMTDPKYIQLLAFQLFPIKYYPCGDFL